MAWVETTYFEGIDLGNTENTIEDFDINWDIDLILDLWNLMKKIDKVKDYNDFARFKEHLIWTINSIFSKDLKWKNDDFRIAFEQSNVSKVQWVDEELRGELRELLQKKNRIYNSLLLKSIILWKLDNILTSDEKNDLKIILKSGIMEYMDELYRGWHKHTYIEKSKNKDLKTKDWKLVYWWLKGWEFVWYNSFVEDEKLLIDTTNFSDIKDENIRKYLGLFSTFINQWITNYDIWVESEVFELETWKNKESIFGIVTPIEDYHFSWVLVEPELVLFLKNKEKIFNNSVCSNLSKEFFDNEYWMNNMTLDFVETLIEWWESTFSWFIWKAFPNDNALSNREWNSIIIKNTDMQKIVINSEKPLKNLFGEEYIFEEKKLYDELLKEVTFHEFWHSLFIKWHPSSSFEEAKATLFYFLENYREYKEWNFSSEDIKRVVEFVIMDSIRTLERIDQEKFFKYVVLTKINLMYLFATWLVSWEEDKLVIDNSEILFEKFINWMKDFLFSIKELYKLDEEELKEREEKILEEIDILISSEINKIIEVMNK